MEFPLQQTGSAQNRRPFSPGQFDMRDWLTRHRLTIVMWDQAFLLRHGQGGSFADYHRVLDETIELNGALSNSQREFPGVRFTASIHGDERWLEIPVQFDCLDVHFYADSDARWRDRTRFAEWLPVLFTTDAWPKEFSDRCMVGGGCHRVQAVT